jgi:hypothetical protein
MDGDGATEGPGAEVGPVVTLLAVGPEESQSVAGGDVGGVVEGGQVASHPGGQNGGGGQYAHADQAEFAGNGSGAGGQGGGDEQERDEEDQLGPHQGFGPAGRAEQDDAHEGGALPQADDGQQDEDHPEHGRCLRHQDAVGDPEVRIGAGQEGGHQADPGTGQSPTEEPHAQHHARPQDGHGHALRRGAGVEAEDPGGRGQEQRGERGMGRALGRTEGHPEELVDSQAEGGEAVPQGVVELAVLVAGDDQDVGHPVAQ